MREGPLPVKAARAALINRAGREARLQDHRRGLEGLQFGKDGRPSKLGQQRGLARLLRAALRRASPHGGIVGAVPAVELATALPGLAGGLAVGVAPVLSLLLRRSSYRRPERLVQQVSTVQMGRISEVVMMRPAVAVAVAATC